MDVCGVNGARLLRLRRLGSTAHAQTPPVKVHGFMTFGIKCISNLLVDVNVKEILVFEKFWRKS